MKVKLIKKEDRTSPAPTAEPESNPDPREWSTAVKSWVKEFKEDRLDESPAAFQNLFDDPTP